MGAFTYRMPAGIAGDVNRGQHSTITPEMITAFGVTGAPTAYGLACKIDATTGKVRMVADPDTTADGFLVRPFPTNSSQDALGTSTPIADGVCDLMRRGFMTVKLGGAAAAVKGGAVYVWSSASATTHVQGQVEAADPTTDGFILAGAYFVGPADANGITEIGFNI